MTGTMIALVLVVAVLLVVGLFGHLILLAGTVAIAFLIGDAHGKGKLALGRRKARGSLGQ